MYFLQRQIYIFLADTAHEKVNSPWEIEWMLWTVYFYLSLLL